MGSVQAPPRKGAGVAVGGGGGARCKAFCSNAKRLEVGSRLSPPPSGSRCRRVLRLTPSAPELVLLFSFRAWCGIPPVKGCTPCWRKSGCMSSRVVELYEVWRGFFAGVAGYRVMG